MLPAVTTKVLVVGATGASVAAAVATGGVAGITNALSHVPVATHAHAVLDAILHAFQSGARPTHPGRS